MRISDWSSDVCSSDLKRLDMLGSKLRSFRSLGPLNNPVRATGAIPVMNVNSMYPALALSVLRNAFNTSCTPKIGRAPCRARVCQLRVDPGGRRQLTKKKYKQNRPDDIPN